MEQILKLSLVIPAYNESDIIESTIEYYDNLFSRMKINYEIIIGDDGSTDNTFYKAHIISGGSRKIKIVRNAKNLGRGAILKKCFFESSGDIIGYVDADLLVSSSMMNRTIEFLRKKDVVIGTKHKTIMEEYSFFRKLLSLFYRMLVGFYLNMHFSDYQGGFKFFRRDKLLFLLEKIKMSGWSWDTEMLYLAVKNKFNVKEVPFSFNRIQKRNSTVKALRDSLQMFKSLLTIKKNH